MTDIDRTLDYSHTLFLAANAMFIISILVTLVMIAMTLTHFKNNRKR
jgi:hypothetical protein